MGNLDEKENRRLLPSTTDCWVLIYRYQSGPQLEHLLRHFSSLGKVLDQRGGGGSLISSGQHQQQPLQGNWVALQYENKFVAEKALQFSGHELESNVYIGAKALMDNDPILTTAANTAISNDLWMGHYRNRACRKSRTWQWWWSDVICAATRLFRWQRRRWHYGK